MTNKSACRRYFDELYHYNPNHDPRNGQFTSGPGGARRFAKSNYESVYGEYLNRDGSLTDKAKRRLKTKTYDPLTENAKSKPKSESTNNSSSDSTNNSNSDSNGNGEKKKGGGDSPIRIDKKGQIHPDDVNKAMSQIEKNIAADYGTRSNAYSKTSDLARQVGNLKDQARRDYANMQASSLDLSNMSDQDMRDYINRKSLEQQYRQAITNESTRGRDAIDTFLTYGGAVLGMAATAATIAATIHTLRS